MLDLTDRSHTPDIGEIAEFIDNPLFIQMLEYIRAEYQARFEFAYSGDKVLLGWNIRLFKAGRTLCRIYPKQGFFSVLVVVGRKERERAEAMEMCETMRTIYKNTKEGMGQRWLLMDLRSADEVYRDTLNLIAIRATSSGR